MFKLGIFFFAFLFQLPSALATTRFVDSAAGTCVGTYNKTLRTCGSGSDGNSYASIELGLAATTAPGDNLWIRGNGTVYSSSIASNNGYVSGGNATARITIGGCPASVCGVNEYPIIRVSGRNGLALDNPNNSYTTITRLILDESLAGQQDQGLYMFFVHHMILDDIELKNVQLHGIICGCDDTEIKNSRFHDIGISAIDPTGATGNANYLNGSRMLVHDNVYYNLRQAAVWFNTYPAVGSYGPWRASDSRFYNNVIHDTRYVGNAAGQNNVFDHNVYWNISSVAFGFSYCDTHLGTYTCGDNNKVIFNTGYNVAGEHVQIGVWGTVSGTVVMNNIFQCANLGTAPVTIATSQTSNNVATYNRFWNCGSVTNNGTNSTINNNTTGDPSFMNVGVHDFHLQSTSNAINAGTAVTGYSSSCVGACDLGAYEYGAGSPAPAPAPAPSPTVASGSITALKVSSPIVIDGVLDSVWSQAKSVTFSNSAFSDNQVKVSILWDDANLYFAYDVKDANREAVNGELFLDDGAEIYLDTGYNRSLVMDSDDFGIMVTINGLTPNAAVQSKTVQNASGYTMEIAVPWSYLQKVPSAGAKLGLLLANNDRDGGVSKQFDWLGLINSGSYDRPNLWGDLVLGAMVQNVAPAAPKNVRVR